MAITGLTCELNRNTGTYGTPVWDAIGLTKDVTLNLEAASADASSRGSGGWREYVQGLKDSSIEFEMVYDPADADFTAISDAFFNGTVLDVVALDGPSGTSGSQGLRMTCVVENFSRSEPLEEAVTVSVVLKPTPNTDSPPEWFTVP